MIALLSIGTLLLILFLNSTGIALLGHRFITSYALSKIASPIIFCLVLFFVEHYAALGDLSWLGVLTTVFSLWIVYRDRAILRANWRIELLFAAAFGYVFLWRFAFPNIDAGSEKLTDLTFISNYLPGSRLPPIDNWLPPFRFDVYYGFQYYSSALLGRLLQLDPGTTYNLSLSFICALTITAAGVTAFLISGRKWWSALPVAALTFGSTGGAVLVPWMAQQTLLSDGVRFIGGFTRHEKMTTGFGKWLAAVARVPQDPGELPAETFGYLVYLGDHHPPMSGFLLLMLGLLCIALIEYDRERRAAPVMLAATLPITVVSNSWNVPLQALLIVWWMLWTTLRGRDLPWRSLAAGFGGALLLCHPFLMGFGVRSLDYATKLRLVPGPEHTPVLLGIILFAPFLVLLVISAMSARHGGPELGWSVLWLALLLVAEFVYVDDTYSGKFNRFNTTLKWWPWIMAGIIVTLGPLALRSAALLRRAGGNAALAILIWFALPMGRHWVRTAKPDLGQLNGAGWIRNDVAEKPILEFLKQQPACRVLQRMETDAFTPGPALVIHAGQQAFLGWPAHEKLWRANRSDIETRSQQVKSFYRGENKASAGWLIENEIEHVLWLKSEAKMPQGAWDRIDAQIRDHYIWREYYRAGDFRVGVWSRRRVFRPAEPDSEPPPGPSPTAAHALLD
jgi:uncharacterized membrane protein